MLVAIGGTAPVITMVGFIWLSSSNTSAPGHEPPDQEEACADEQQDLLASQIAAAQADQKTDGKDDHPHQLKESADQSAHGTFCSDGAVEPLPPALSSMAMWVTVSPRSVWSTTADIPPTTRAKMV